MNDQIVYAMAFSRQKALERLDSLSLPISEHMYKLLALPKHQSAFHWKQELKGWRKALTRYNVSKTKSSNYNETTLKKYLYIEPLGLEIDLDLLKKIIEDEYDLKLKTPKSFHIKLEKVIDAFIKAVMTNNDDWLKGL